jgi:predicted HicB family RNase H-like nuclease
MDDMPQLNVQVSEDAHRAAKIAAINAGMQIREWVERAVLAQAGAESHDKRTVKLREPAR